MGGKQSPRPQLFLVGGIFQHRPGDAHPVKGRGPPPDLIENEQAPLCGVAQDLRHLVHLHHEGGPPGKEIVRRPHPGEHPVAHADVGAPRGDKAPALGHNADERHLAHKGGFARHVGAGDDVHPVFPAVEEGVVGDEEIVLQHPLHHRVPPVPDVDPVGIVHRGADIVVLHRRPGQGAQNVRHRHRLGDGLEPLHLGGDLFPHPGEELIFQRRQPVRGRKDLPLQRLELRGDVALAARQGLLADIILGHLPGIAPGDLDIIAENLVVAHLELGDAGALPLLLLDPGQPGGPAAQKLPQLVGPGIEARADDPALPQGKGRLVHDGAADELPHVDEGVHLVQQLPQKGRTEGLQPRPDVRQLLAHRPKGPQVPPVGRAIDDAAGDALHIVDPAEGLFQALPGHEIPRQGRHGLLPPLDGGDAEEGLFQPLAQKPRPHGRPGLVQHPEEAPLFLSSVERGGELQVPPGGVVQLHILALAIDLQPGDVAQLAFLGLMQIGQQSPRRPDQELLLRGKGLLGKLLCRRFPGALFHKAPFTPLLHAGAQPVPGKGAQPLVAVGPVGEQKLPGGEPPQLIFDVGHRVGPQRLGPGHFPGGDVAEAHPRSPAVPIDRGDEIVAALVQHGAFQHCPRADLADDLPPHQTLGQSRVLHLFADGYLISLGHQTPDIALGAVIRDPAHGGPLGLTALPSRKGEIQLPGHQLGVVKEHLIEIPQAVHEDAVGVLLLHVEILLHHGGEAVCAFSPGLFLLHSVISPSQTAPRWSSGRSPPRQTARSCPRFPGDAPA